MSFLNILLSVIAMGRRKSKRKPPPKKKITGDLDTQFTCPFCNHEKSCDVKMYETISSESDLNPKIVSGLLAIDNFLFASVNRERSRNTGIISCTVCLEEFQTPINCILVKTWTWSSHEPYSCLLAFMYKWLSISVPENHTIMWALFIRRMRTGQKNSC